MTIRYGVQALNVMAFKLILPIPWLDRRDVSVITREILSASRIRNSSFRRCRSFRRRSGIEEFHQLIAPCLRGSMGDIFL